MFTNTIFSNINVNNTLIPFMGWYPLSSDSTLVGTWGELRERDVHIIWGRAFFPPRRSRESSGTAPLHLHAWTLAGVPWARKVLSWRFEG